ncbi:MULTISPECIES: tyrosine-type recombinase/integrase [unclassified Caballeronia]|uniref:tyrosine-type recombinase/integrase n=1 Tax=unclassified Caballeronia TaxID=2646786 RepID=UPI00285C03FB|nr:MULTISPECIES: tyrosine-type recombinase/integrase [unclassified Caballeronia]MDR5776812.1 tyrosine-type recombinase/integrase [Caballeronia sp. LZ002]MDR5798671.1 tyrosine-type recombinase/integrase [Caballeronia sp. LZ001]MDR5852252.1 tyrosine-type recombinase/integrase [Caballeronia sp. LZ003]
MLKSDLPFSSARAMQPMPLEMLVVPSELDGGAGANRALSGRAQIAATNDLDAIRAWLSRFADKKTTFENYRKEAERLLLWSLATLSKPISSLTHEDCLRYQRFLLDPQPASTWVAGGGRKHPRTDARWRPFYGPLSPASQRQAIVILNAMFSWLVQAGYLAGNPLSLSRQRARQNAPRITRYLEPGIWQEVKDSIAAMSRETARDTAHAYRVRWLFTLLYLGGLRIAEVGNNTMGQFFMRRDSDGAVRWWLAVRGKGDKERLVPATREMMTELSRYRQHLGLSALPSQSDDTPLVLPIGATFENGGVQTRPALTRAALHAIVKEVFARAAARLRERDALAGARADLLEKASAHWLRHSAGSHMVDRKVDLRLVRDNFGHASLTTTSMYLHLDDDRRHQETDEKHLIDW